MNQCDMECADSVKTPQTAISAIQAGLLSQMNGFPTSRHVFGEWFGYDSDAELMDDGIQGLVSFSGRSIWELMDL